MRQHLGPDWAEALIHARAFVGSKAVNGQIDATLWHDRAYALGAEAQPVDEMTLGIDR